jgi:hypothetical protein
MRKTDCDLEPVKTGKDLKFMVIVVRWLDLPPDVIKGKVARDFYIEMKRRFYEKRNALGLTVIDLSILEQIASGIGTSLTSALIELMDANVVRYFPEEVPWPDNMQQERVEADILRRAQFDKRLRRDSDLKRFYGQRSS